VRCDVGDGEAEEGGGNYNPPGGNDNPQQEPQLLRYSYSEGEDAAAFFSPLAWAVAVRRSPDIYWYPSNIKLFDPVAAGITAGEPPE
jgi:hypothetical protein